METTGIPDRGLTVPVIGAQVFIEPGQAPEEIDAWFRIMHEHNMTICRIRMFEVYMHRPDGSWDFSLFDQAFTAAEKHAVKILATVFPAASFTDLGGFKFPRSEEHLQAIAEYIKNSVNHFKTFKSLYGWVLMNEPGLGMPFRGGGLPDEPFTNNKLALWKQAQPAPVYRSKGYPVMDFARERFVLDYTVWFLGWLKQEITKYDPGRHLHVNNHAIFQNAAEYDFPRWRPILSSLGGSAHASWHFGYFKRSRYAVAMAADCELVRSGAGELPWIITEIQGGNNTYSGFEPMCPTYEEICQWLWIIIGCSGKGGIFWCLNPRASGREAGEWALLNFHDEPSGRFEAAAAVAGVIQSNSALFANANAVRTGINILYVREALWIEKQLQTGGTHYEGRDEGGVMKSALAYFEACCEMGVQCNFKAIDEFDFGQEDYTGCTIILAHQVSIPSRHWKTLEHFAACGGKLIVDGLTAYYDENAHCIMKTGFPLIKLFGASINEFRLAGNLFDVKLAKPDLVLPGHCWQGTIRSLSAVPIGKSGNEITAVRNSFGKGNVVWIPALIGLGSRLTNYKALAALLYAEAGASIAALPLRFKNHQPGFLMKTLQSGKSLVAVIINKGKTTEDIPLIAGTAKQPVVLFAGKQGKVLKPDKIRIYPEETLVIKWET